MSSDASNLPMYQEFFLKERNIKLETEIFEGSSVAFQGYHETFKKKVFVKFIPIPWDNDQNIEHEVETLIKLRDKQNIVNVFDSFIDAQTGSQLVIVTEYLEGNTLDKFCGLSQISLKQAIDIVMELIVGVSDVHNLGLVHRDLKLENIIYDGNKPIIVDLGSVKSIGAKVLMEDPIPYMYRSSEVFLKGIYSIQSDIYQIGLILFQLVNGSLPTDIEYYAELSKVKLDLENTYQEGIKQLKKLVAKDQLINVIPPLPIYCSKINRVIINAIKLRYKTLDSFYKDLSKIKSEVPDWVIQSESEYLCKEWRRKKYRVVKNEEGYRIFNQTLIRTRELIQVSSSSELNKYFQNI
ncbi:serine/threonine protein kinase [Paenibacillus cellulosilyticus]|uniref:non-specific serine/threonine protein kinase n=1 Tax=Paenibacillus cellulosilyticus TaxID=375489 RepID=A0A2V2YE92_9BACL|nr:protein kinase [Paenibacillus cellulosilyticus]PWV90616.1 serine/threonine protein kinase [Paenibacillus cellulosilyticus]QKS45221.1 protein kinase [Paenibacillus cellulosilyticus]